MFVIYMIMEEVWGVVGWGGVGYGGGGGGGGGGNP